MIGCQNSTATSRADDKLCYRVVAGKHRHHADTASLKEFAQWAQYEVRLNESSWQRVDVAPTDVKTDYAA